MDPSRIPPWWPPSGPMHPPSGGAEMYQMNPPPTSQPSGPMQFPQNAPQGPVRLPPSTSYGFPLGQPVLMPWLGYPYPWANHTIPVVRYPATTLTPMDGSVFGGEQMAGAEHVTPEKSMIPVPNGGPETSEKVDVAEPVAEKLQTEMEVDTPLSQPMSGCGDGNREGVDNNSESQPKPESIDAFIEAMLSGSAVICGEETTVSKVCGDNNILHFYGEKKPSTDDPVTELHDDADSDQGKDCDNTVQSSTKIDPQDVYRWLTLREYPPHCSKRDEKSNFRSQCAAFKVQGMRLYHKCHSGKQNSKRKGREHHPQYALVVVKRSEQLRLMKFAHEGHDSSVESKSLAPHRGQRATTDILARRVWWPGFSIDVKKYVRTCDACQKINAATLKCRDPLCPIPPPRQNLKQIGIDIICLPEVDGFRYAVIAIDYLSKFCHGKALKHKSAEEVAKFIFEWVCMFGVPQVQINDQGKEFCNKVAEELHKRLGVHQRVTRAYSPQTNGLCERQNRTIKCRLLKVLRNHVQDWPKALDGVMFGHRVQTQKSTGYSPFFMLFGQEPRLPVDMEAQQETDALDTDSEDPDPGDVTIDEAISCHDTQDKDPYDVDALDQFVRDFEVLKSKVISNARENALDAQEDQKRRYDKHHLSDQFRVGDKVLKKNLRRDDRKGGWSQERWTGPYEIACVNKFSGCRLRNSRGQVLVETVSLKNLKLYLERDKDCNEESEEVKMEGELPKKDDSKKGKGKKRKTSDVKPTPEKKDEKQKRKNCNKEDPSKSNSPKPSTPEPDAPKPDPENPAAPTPIGFLSNGLKCKTTVLDNRFYKVTNTCAVDSLVFLVGTAFMDSEDYRRSLEKEENMKDFIKLLREICDKGQATTEAYLLRANILLKMFENSQSVRGNTTTVDCNTNISVPVNHIFSSFPTVTTRSVCSMENCPLKVRCSTTAVICISVPAGGFGNLAHHIEQYVIKSPDFNCLAKFQQGSNKGSREVNNLRGDSSDLPPPCVGTRTHTKTLSKFHIFVEIIATNKNCLAECETRLSEVPDTLLVNGVTYTFRGVVAYEGTRETRVKSLGHYCANARRRNGQWESYNDLRSNVTSCDSNEIIRCHLFLFTV